MQSKTETPLHWDFLGFVDLLFFVFLDFFVERFFVERLFVERFVFFERWERLFVVLLRQYDFTLLPDVRLWERTPD